MFPSLYDNNLRKSIKNLFQRCDIIIPVTNMARNALIKLGLDYNVTENVYNGIDFDKRITKKYSKQEIFNNTIPEDTFMFFSVSENSDRKLLDRMIYAFKLFLTKVENPTKYRLYIHTNFADIKGGTDLLSMVVNNKLENYIILPRNFVDNQFIPTEILYQRFSVSDCYLSLTGGEGMGLGVLQSMMHKVPVIYSTYGAPAEYLKGIGYPVNVQTYINAKNIDVKWGLVDLEEASDQMLYMVENRDKAKLIAEDAFKFAKENFDWDVIFPKLLTIVEENYKRFNVPKVLLKQII
jgi:glycosyltransferase involved in cell wall biosynthesis